MDKETFRGQITALFAVKKCNKLRMDATYNQS